MGVFLHIAANSVLPKSLVEQLFKANPGGCSFMFIKDGVPQDLNMEGQYTLDNVVETIDLLKDHPVWMHFSNNTPATPEDYQPYKVLQEAGAPMVMLMGEGDFQEKTDGSHSGVFYYSFDELLPELAEAWDNSGKDIKKLASKVNSQIWEKRITNAIPSVGCVVLFYAHGEYKRFIKGTDHVFSWGWTTNPYDYKEGSFPERSSTKSIVDKLKGALGKPIASVVPIKQTDTKVPAGGKTTPELVADAQVNIEYEVKYPPHHFTLEKNRRDWYKGVMKRECEVITQTGNTTQFRKMKYEELTREMIMGGKGVGLRFPVVKKTTVKLENLGSALAKPTVASAEKELAAKDAKRSNKDTAPHHIPSKAPASVPGQVTTEVLPVLSENQQKSLDSLFAREDVKTMLDLSARRMPFDPKTLQGKEQKFQSFAQSRGLKDTRMLAHLSLKALWDMGKIDPLALAILCSDWRALAMQYAPAYKEETTKSLAEVMAERKAARAASKA